MKYSDFGIGLGLKGGKKSREKITIFPSREKGKRMEIKGVNLVRFFGFWLKSGTRTGIPRFLVLENQNRELGPNHRPVPICTESGNRFFKKIIF